MRVLLNLSTLTFLYMYHSNIVVITDTLVCATKKQSLDVTLKLRIIVNTPLCNKIAVSNINKFIVTMEISSLN